MARRSSSSNRGNGKSAWQKARETTANDQPFGDAVPVDTGRYTMQIVGAAIDKQEKGSMVRTNWCVIDNDDFDGVICTNWDGPCEDPDRLIWIQRNLAALGVDLDEVDYEKPEDLVDVYNELIEDNVCANVRVLENDGYINMRIGKEKEVDEDLLVDPKAALSGKASSSSKAKDEEAEEEAEDAFEKGDEVTFKKGRKTETGTVVGYDEDDNVLVKVGKKKIAMAEDKLTLVEAEEEVEEEAEEEEEASWDWDSIQVGDKVTVNFEEDGELEAEVTSKPPRSKKKNEIQVTVEGDDEPEMISIDMITNWEPAETEEEESEEEEEEEAEEEEGSLEFEVGDEVTFKKGRTTLAGIIKAIDEQEETAAVKIKGKRVTETVAFDKLAHVVVE